MLAGYLGTIHQQTPKVQPYSHVHTTVTHHVTHNDTCSTCIEGRRRRQRQWKKCRWKKDATLEEDADSGGDDGGGGSSGGGGGQGDDSTGHGDGTDGTGATGGAGEMLAAFDSPKMEADLWDTMPEEHKRIVLGYWEELQQADSSLR